MLSFKTEESFIKEYSELSSLSTVELKSWISSKKVASLLNTYDDSISMEVDNLSESRIIYSDALKAVLNSEFKIKINGKVLWLHDRTFYLLSENEVNKTPEQLSDEKSQLQVYGSLLSVSKSSKNLTGRYVIPNENGVKTFYTEEDQFNVPGVRFRHVLDLFNETIVFNDRAQSSKMYLRFTLQYRSCSSFRCTWKTASNSTIVDAYNVYATSKNWVGSPFTDDSVIGSKTFELATWKPEVPNIEPYWYTNFVVSGTVKIYVENAWHEISLSWY